MTPYLVQRLIPKKLIFPNGKGIDKYFTLDYMGSAEFEFGAPSKSIIRLRADIHNVHNGRIIQTLRFENRKNLYYVGKAEYVDTVSTLFLNPDGARLKESLHFEDERVIGWWDIENDWAVFRNMRYVHRWLDGLLNR